MRKKLQIHFGRIALFFVDFLLMVASCIGLSWFLRGKNGVLDLLPESVLYVVGTLFALFVTGMYRRMLKRLSVRDLAFGVLAITAAFTVGAVATLLHDPSLIPYTLFCFVLFIMELIVTRIGIYFMLNHMLTVENKGDTNPVLIVGAGSAGVMLAKELMREPEKGHPLYFCDDDESKIGMTIEGIRVLSSTMLIPDVCEKYGIKTIYIALPSADEKKVNAVQETCKRTSCAIYHLPFISSLVTNKPFIKQTRQLRYAEVLGREEVLLHSNKTVELINNRVVLVTGGGGSIGSELCRQIADLGPRQLIIVDIYENNAYDIQQDLIMKNPGLNLCVEIASVRDADKMDVLFAKYRPHIVFHAAAHKHVPLMEYDPEEAVKNNIGGTYNVASVAAKYEVEKFVLISTDKAVNPTNVMGATKRFCEMIVQHIGSNAPQTCFTMVRFGNVLGSNGSVIPLFKKQIESGGPVKVTHPDIVRYFMTIPEAVSLVMQAGAMAKGGEVFVLNMGEAVKILTLAENIIKFYGYKPYTDIPIQFTGLRPGEKLYEELLMDEEGLQSTESEKIFIGKQVEVDHEVFPHDLEEILQAAHRNDSKEVVRLLHKIITTYRTEQKH